MNRLFRAALVAALMPVGLASVGCAHKSGSGCGAGGSGTSCGDHYRNWVDPCWPDRYNYAARQAVVAPVRPAGCERPLPAPDALELLLRAGQRQADARRDGQTGFAGSRDARTRSANLHPGGSRRCRHARRTWTRSRRCVPI